MQKNKLLHISALLLLLSVNIKASAPEETKKTTELSKIIRIGNVSGATQARTPLIQPVARIVGEYAYQEPLEKVKFGKTSNPQFLLWRAVQNDLVDDAKKLINDGVSVNFVIKGYYPLLGYATSAKMIKLLIQAGADVNAQDENGDNVIKIAVATNVSKILEIAETLIDEGANPYMKNNQNKNTFDLLERIRIRKDIAPIYEQLKTILKRYDPSKAGFTLEERAQLESIEQKASREEEIRNINKRLINAIKKDDIAEAEAMIIKGAAGEGTPEAAQAEKEAIERGNPEMIKKLQMYGIIPKETVVQKEKELSLEEMD